MIEAQTQMLLDILEVSQRNRRAIPRYAKEPRPTWPNQAADFILL
jgi:hypothetical protein